MTKQHKALGLAHDLESWAKAYATTDYTDEMANNSAAELRSMHALIVQMREALAPFAVYGRHGSRDVEVGSAIAALAAADQYLGEQA